EGLRHGSLVGHRDVDACLVARGRNRLQASLGAPRERDGRPPRRQVDHADVAPPHAGAQTGAQRFGAGLFGREALGVALDSVSPVFGAGAFGRGKNPIDGAGAVPLGRFGKAAHVGDIGSDPEDHPSVPLLRLPRSIAARILHTTAPSPSKMASPIRKWPILSSTISVKAAIFSTVIKSRPWPACTSRPTLFAKAAPRRMRSNSAAPAAASPFAKASHQAPV